MAIERVIWAGQGDQVGDADTYLDSQLLDFVVGDYDGVPFC
jgi:hypothetical protein